MKTNLKIWWLYHGPGLKRYREWARTKDEILPIKGEVRDAHFGAMRLEAEGAVATLRQRLTAN